MSIHSSNKDNKDLNSSKTHKNKKEVHGMKKFISSFFTKSIKVDGKKIKVDLINGVKPKDVSDEFTGSHPNIKTPIDKVLPWFFIMFF